MNASKQWIILRNNWFKVSKSSFSHIRVHYLLRCSCVCESRYLRPVCADPSGGPWGPLFWRTQTQTAMQELDGVNKDGAQDETEPQHVCTLAFILSSLPSAFLRSPRSESVGSLVFISSRSLFSAVARHLSPVRERLRQSSVIFPVTLLVFIMSCAVCGFLGFSVAQFEGQVRWAGVCDDRPAAVSLWIWERRDQTRLELHGLRNTRTHRDLTERNRKKLSYSATQIIPATTQNTHSIT